MGNGYFINAGVGGVPTPTLFAGITLYEDGEVVDTGGGFAAVVNHIGKAGSTYTIAVSGSSNFFGAPLDYSLRIFTTPAFSGPDDIEILTAVQRDETTVGFTYGSNATFNSTEFGLYRSADPKYDPGEDELVDSFRRSNVSPGEFTEVFALTEPLEFDPERPYLIVFADSQEEHSEADEINNIFAIRTEEPADIAAGFLFWNAVESGVNFTYLLDGTLSEDVPVGLYWSEDQTFDSSDVFAAETQIRADQEPELLHIPASEIRNPPAGASYLLAVIDPLDDIIENNEDNNENYTAYEPSVTVTAKIDGNPDSDIIGRFLAVTDVVTDQTLDIRLSESLAALRPSLSVSINEHALLNVHPKLEANGSWDGSTYETEEFDPGFMQGCLCFPLKHF